jgi:hypothetical protein
VSEVCTVCGSEKAKTFNERGQKDTLCYICSAWFVVECQRRTGFGNTIVVVMEPKDDGEAVPVIGRKKDMEPIN